MIYKGEKEVKLLILNSNECYITIGNQDNLINIIEDNLNSVDYDLIQEKKSEINVIEFNITNDNNLQTYSSGMGDMKYNKIYQIYYSIINKNNRKEI